MTVATFLSRPSTRERRSTLYRDACAAVCRRHADPNLTIDDVAREIATSRRQLQRVMLEVGGVPFREVLRRVRMVHARSLLSSTPLPVKDVCRRVGYRQPAQFAKTFRACFGQTPIDYRTSMEAEPGPGPERQSRA